MNKKTKNTTTSKKPIAKQWWFWLIIVAVIGVIAIAAGGSDTSPKTLNPDGSQNTQKTSFTIGDTISYNNTEITVTSIERNYSTGNEFIVPSNGNEYIKINLTIVNRSGNTISYNVLDWEIEDSNGVIQSTLSAAFASADDDLGSGQLAKDGKKSGSLVFEIPSGDTNLKLHYRPSLLSSDELIINL